MTPPPFAKLFRKIEFFSNDGFPYYPGRKFPGSWLPLKLGGGIRKLFPVHVQKLCPYDFSML